MKKIESTRPESVQLVKAVSNGIRDALKAAHPRTEQNKIVLWIRELFRGVTMLTRVLRK